MADFALALPVVASFVVAMAFSLGLSVAYALSVLAVYASAALLILSRAPAGFPGRGMGPANRVTLGRLALAVPLAGLALSVGGLSIPARWWIVGLGTVALLVDGLDGWVARRTSTATRFGARFDMETDAALLMVLCLLAWKSGQVGPWVLAIGAMRYLFVAASWILPGLAGPLFPSMRRKVVCVAQGAALLICVGPIVPPDLAQGVVAAALVALSASFTRDTVWLLASERSTTVPAPSPEAAREAA